MAMPLTKDVEPLVFTGIEAGGIVLFEPVWITGGLLDCEAELTADDETTGGLEELTAAEDALAEENTDLVAVLLDKLDIEELSGEEPTFGELYSDEPIPV